MRHNLTYLVAVAAMLSVATGWSFLQETATGVGATQSAKAFLATLSAEQKSIAVLPLDSPQRVDWHVIPKAQRKGLQLKDMTDGQRQAALALLRSVLSPAGYEKATKVMALEATIRELEKSRQGGAIRDPERYYFTLFGEPSEVSRWGLSIEGHHLSLNFLVDSGVVIASTPMFFAANPHVVREGMPGNVPPGIRTLADEELLAFQLIESLDAQQRTAEATAQINQTAVFRQPFGKFLGGARRGQIERHAGTHGADRGYGQQQEPRQKPVRVDAGKAGLEKQRESDQRQKQKVDVAPPDR